MAEGWDGWLDAGGLVWPAACLAPSLAHSHRAQQPGVRQRDDLVEPWQAHLLLASSATAVAPHGSRPWHSAAHHDNQQVSIIRCL
jgi:hypothetical protein